MNLDPATASPAAFPLRVRDAVQDFGAFCASRAADPDALPLLSDWMLSWLLLGDGVHCVDGGLRYAEFAVSMALAAEDARFDPGSPCRTVASAAAQRQGWRASAHPFGAGPDAFATISGMGPDERDDVGRRFVEAPGLLRGVFGQ